MGIHGKTRDQGGKETNTMQRGRRNVHRGRRNLHKMQRGRRNVHMKVLKSQTSPDGSNPGVTSIMFVKVFVSSKVAIGIRICCFCYAHLLMF